MNRAAATLVAILMLAAACPPQAQGQVTPKKICDLPRITTPAPDLFFEMSAACGGSKSGSYADMFQLNNLIPSISGLTPHRVVGTCGSSTTLAICQMPGGDLVDASITAGKIANPGTGPSLFSTDVTGLPQWATVGGAGDDLTLAVVSGVATFSVTSLHLGTPTLCGAGNFARGIDGSGNATGCTLGGTGTVTNVTGPAALLTWASGSTTPTASLATQSALTLFGNNTGSTATPGFFVQSALSHGALGNLTSGDDHTQYVLKAGRAGGQTVNGGSAPNEQLLLHGSSNASSGGVGVSGADPFYLVGANGQYWAHGQSTELVTLSGTPKDTAGTLLPANSTIRAVVVRITTGVSGSCSSFNVGDPTTASRFATGMAVTTNTTAVGLAHIDQSGAAGPRQTAAAVVRMTCASGTLTGGAARITVFYDQFVAPAS